MQSVKRLLYSLKNRYGSPIDLYREVIGEPNILTGRTEVIRTKYHINKGILIKQRVSELEKFFAKTDGLMEIDDFTLLLDGKDLPKDFIPQLEDYIIQNENRYDINVIHSLNNNEAYYIGIKEFKGSEIPRIYDIILHDKLTLIQTMNIIHNYTYYINLVDTLEFNDSVVLN